MEYDDSGCDSRQFIEDELRKAGIFYRPGRPGNIAIECPYHVSDSRQLKLEIAYSGYPFSCWTCREGGHYNQLAEKLGMAKLPASAQYSPSNIERQIEELNQPVVHPTLPKGLEPWVGDWRGLNEIFLNRFGSKRYFDPFSNGWRILWPVKYNGKLQGWTSGRLDKQLEPKYRNGPLSCFKATKALWPIDAPEIKDTAILVEGQYDALRLIYEDLPGVCFFGTANWTQRKVNMLLQRKQPVKKVIIATDGDDEGWGCAERIWKDTRSKFDSVEIFQLPDGKDPGNCSDNTIDRLKELHQSVTGLV